MEKQKCVMCEDEIARDWDDCDVAFIKSDTSSGHDMWVIYAADGTKLASTDNREYAFAVARQNNLTPKSVH